jgi:hypothetical protein
MMDQFTGHMNGWLGGGMWLWTIIGVLLIVVLIVTINWFPRK